MTEVLQIGLLLVGVLIALRVFHILHNWHHDAQLYRYLRRMDHNICVVVQWKGDEWCPVMEDLDLFLEEHMRGDEL